MIPVKEDRRVISGGVEESIAFGISAKNSVHIMGILRDQLYSDKIMAVIREISANAIDANVMSGRGDRPIDVTLPTVEDPCLRIRDSGPGLGLDDIREVFSQYGESTKRESNTGIGMLGIGSKSPFAYSDSFVVISWHGGSRATYNAVIDESGAGRIDLLDVADCGSDETGLEVQVAVRPADCKAFEDRARSLFMHFDPRPNTNIELPPPPKVREVPRGKISDDNGYGGGWTAVMGNIPYQINIDQLVTGTGGSNLSRSCRNVSGTLTFDIGELQVAASRESLKYSDQTRALLIARLNAAIEDYVRLMLTGLESMSQWEQRLRVSAVSQRSLPIPTALKHLAAHHVDVKSDMTAGTRLKSGRGGSGGLNRPLLHGQHFGLQSRDYRSKMTAVGSIAVDPCTRLVVRDDRRVIAGFALQARDIVVNGYEASPAVTAKALREFLTANKIEGIPTVMLSSLKWSRPESRKASVPRDQDKARARLLVLNPGALTDTGPRSPVAWVPSLRVPADSDVFVVLESYRVVDHDSFPERFLEDESLLKNLGLKMPEILGHKSTKAHPVSARSCKGTEYRAWRNSGMIALLLTHPEVASTVDATSYSRTGLSSYDSWFQGQGADLIAPELGEDHPVSLLASRERAAISNASKASHLVQRAVQVVRGSSGRPMAIGDRERAAMISRYPLLMAAPAGALVGSHRKLWFDYIRLIDSVSASVPAMKGQETA